jgi:hypothetical protein
MVIRLVILGSVVLGLTVYFKFVIPVDNKQLNNNAYALQQYDIIKNDVESRAGRDLFLEAISERIQCYLTTQIPNDRHAKCVIPYLEKVVEIARGNIKSSPQLGKFLKAVQYCPVVYSMCNGDDFETVDCKLIECRCINYALDMYWRGWGPAHE